MTKPMLIEALKQGMRAKVLSLRVVCCGNNIIDEVTGVSVSNIDTLMSTNYEIIRDTPKPWTPTKGHGGFVVMPYMGEIELLPGNSDHWKFALKTPEAAKHKAKLDLIFTAILNMPGYGGDFACVHMTTTGRFIADSHPSCSVLKFNFETFADAIVAADYANKLMEASHA